MAKQEEEKQTYREAVQNVIREIWTAYEKVGALRDAAASNEKDYFNDARGQLYNAAIGLGKMDDRMPADRATMKLNGRY